MKKYIKPVLEVVEIIDRSQLICATQTPWADGKENNLFFFDEDDESDLWKNDSEKTNMISGKSKLRII